MALRTTNKSAVPKFGSTKLRTKHQFVVLYMKSFSKFVTTMHKLKTSIMDLIKATFPTMTTDEVATINTCFGCGSAFVIMAFAANASKAHCVGTNLFLADHNGIWVNWLVISKH